MDFVIYECSSVFGFQSKITLSGSQKFKLRNFPRSKPRVQMHNYRNTMPANVFRAHNNGEVKFTAESPQLNFHSVEFTIKLIFPSQ